MVNFIMRCSRAIGSANLLISAVYFVLWIPIYFWHPFFSPYTMDDVHPLCYVIENIILISMLVAFFLLFFSAISYVFLKLPFYVFNYLFSRLEDTEKKSNEGKCLMKFTSKAGKISFYSFLVFILLWICARASYPWENPHIVPEALTNYFDLMAIIVGSIACQCGIIYGLLKLYNAILPYIRYWRTPFRVASLIFQLITYMVVFLYCLFN